MKNPEADNKLPGIIEPHPPPDLPLEGGGTRFIIPFRGNNFLPPTTLLRKLTFSLPNGERSKGIILFHFFEIGVDDVVIFFASGLST